MEPTARESVVRSPINRPDNFGRRRELPTITIERGSRRKQYQLSLTSIAVAVSILIMFSIGYFSATAYLFFREDLATLQRDRNVRKIREYEERIATLRANMDRLTSLQLLDQQTLEDKVGLLLRRQVVIETRSTDIEGLLKRAAEAGLAGGWNQPSPVPEEFGFDANATVFRGSLDGTGSVGAYLHTTPARNDDKPDLSNARVREDTLAAIAGRIDATDLRQQSVMEYLGGEAVEKLNRASQLFSRLNIGKADEAGAGGPFEPLPAADAYESRISVLNEALERLEQLNVAFDGLPLAVPIAEAVVSSAFGKRIDPFLGKAAMHSGIDFAAEAGTPVKASGSGTVVEAGWNGGYGNTVLVDHGSGLSSRYAHLQRISVGPGDVIENGAKIGAVGSTGRSTGPHLHYEILRNDVAENPARFLKAGRQLH